LAQEITAQFPDRIKKVILVSTTPGIKGKFPTLMTIGMMAQLATYVAATRVFNGERDYKELFIIPNPIGVAHQVFALAHWSFNGRLFNDNHEVLIMGGKKDPLLPHGNSWRIKKNFKNAEVYLAPTGNHMWVLDSAETSSSIVNDFLSGE
jgi:pimeloyl-ACP methyl ester carboxylesterase